MKASPSLDAYYREVFEPQWLQSCSARILQRHRQAVDMFYLFMKRELTIADIKADNLERFAAWLIETKRAGRKKVNPAYRFLERLRQIRRYASFHETSGGREMMLRDFFSEIYVKERPLSDKSYASYRSAIRMFGRFIGGQAMLSELTGTNLALFATSPHCRRSVEDCLRAVWQFAYELGYVTTSPAADIDKPRGAVTTQGDTLRHLLTAKYFPARFNIRSEQTKLQYRYALNDLQSYLEHEPTLDDLTDEKLEGFLRYLEAKKLAPKTINERAGRIRALWNWLAKRGVVRMFPTFGLFPEPSRSPVAWTREELEKLFVACDQATGKIADCPANLYMTALHRLLWNTGERIGAVRAIKRSWINRESMLLHVPAEVRKGGRKEAWYSLWPETLEAIDALLACHTDETVFPWRNHATYFWVRYSKFLKRAGLPHDRKHSFHTMRRSFATWLNVGGGDDTKALGHSSSHITEKSYRDPRIVGAQPVNLFRPWEGGAG